MTTDTTLARAIDSIAQVIHLNATLSLAGKGKPTPPAWDDLSPATQRTLRDMADPLARNLDAAGLICRHGNAFTKEAP